MCMLWRWGGFGPEQGARHRCDKGVTSPGIVGDVASPRASNDAETNGPARRARGLSGSIEGIPVSLDSGVQSNELVDDLSAEPLSLEQYLGFLSVFSSVKIPKLFVSAFTRLLPGIPKTMLLPA